MAQSEDRRVRRTRERLRQALTQLLLEKDVRDITVRELTDLADVNRGTFYTHYRDIYDMREQMERELFQQLSDMLRAYDAQSIRGSLRPILTAVFRFIVENRELFGSVLGGGGEALFFTRLQGLIHDLYLRQWSGTYDLGGGADANYSLEFLVSGVAGLVRAWAREGMAEPPEAMAALAESLILSGLSRPAAES